MNVQREVETISVAEWEIEKLTLTPSCYEWGGLSLTHGSRCTTGPEEVADAECKQYMRYHCAERDFAGGNTARRTAHDR